MGKIEGETRGVVGLLAGAMTVKAWQRAKVGASKSPLCSEEGCGSEEASPGEGDLGRGARTGQEALDREHGLATLGARNRGQGWLGG